MRVRDSFTHANEIWFNFRLNGGYDHVSEVCRYKTAIATKIVNWNTQKKKLRDNKKYNWINTYTYWFKLKYIISLFISRIVS